MTRTDYLDEIAHFKHVLSALDAQHRLNGHQYTPSEIQNVRRALNVLEQLVQTGVYDVNKVAA